MTLNEGIAPENKLEHIERLTQLTKSYFQGLHQSEELTVAIGAQKLKYLNGQNELGLQKDSTLTKCYAEQDFKTQFNKLLAQPIALIHFNQEYLQHLKQFLEQSKQDIISAAMEGPNIHQKICTLMCQKLGEFEQRCLKFYAKMKKSM